MKILGLYFSFKFGLVLKLSLFPIVLQKKIEAMKILFVEVALIEAMKILLVEVTLYLHKCTKDLVWDAIVMSGLVYLIATLICWRSYRIVTEDCCSCTCYFTLTLGLSLKCG